jgi:hypothetical protein
LTLQALGLTYVNMYAFDFGVLKGMQNLQGLVPKNKFIAGAMLIVASN